MSELRVPGLPGQSGEGLTRTDIHCTECGKTFIGEVDFGLDGEHVIECPYCAHEHFRIIAKGVITEARWQSRSGQPVARRVGRTQWKHSSLPAKTTTVSAFIRDLWLNREDVG